MSLKEFILSKQFLKLLGYAAVIAVGVLIITMLWLNIYTRHGQALTVPDFRGLTLEETQQLAKKSKVNFYVIDSVYSDDAEKGTVIEQNPVPGFKVKKWRNVSLIVNAIRPEMVPMPSLTELPLRQAIAVLENSGLKVGELIYKPDLSIDVVLNQQFNGEDIQSNTLVEKGSFIDLTLGKGLSNQRTTVPDLKGYSLERAKSRIIGASLNLGTYIYDNTIISSADSSSAFVYQQNPVSGENETAQLGSSIYLWLTTDSVKLLPDSTLIAPPDSLNFVIEI